MGEVQVLVETVLDFCPSGGVLADPHSVQWYAGARLVSTRMVPSAALFLYCSIPVCDRYYGSVAAFEMPPLPHRILWRLLA
jgi:hypothetical protein